MRISYVIPAHNEADFIAATLLSIADSATALGIDHQVIVVNDASTDQTGPIARQMGAKVIDVELRKIGAVRNAGARHADGDVLVFVDADTLVTPMVLEATVRAIQGGAVGGGARVAFDGDVPFLLRCFVWWFSLIWFGMRWAAGCYLFARRDAFEKVGGFDEQYFVSEEMWLSKALKREGRFVILSAEVVTSSRKARQFGQWGLLRRSFALMFRGPKAYRRRDGLELWYEPDR